MQIMETLLIACPSFLAVEVTVRLWPRLYNCGSERPNRRPVRYLVIYPALVLGMLLSRDRLDAVRVALLLVLATIAALDLAYHHISLPFEALLIILSIVSIARAEWPVFNAVAGLVFGGLTFIVALVTCKIGWGDAVVMAAVGALAAEQAWLVLIVSAVLALTSSRLSRQQVFPLAFAVGTALLFLSCIW